MMVANPEFPSIPFRPLVRVAPNGNTRWTAGRKSGQPSVIFIHTTEGGEGPTAAEDGAAYDARRTDGTSTHFFVDGTGAVQEVETWNEAHAARSHGNDVGIQIEICGRAGQSIAQWNDANSAAIVEQAARLCVAIRARYGKDRFPLVNLTPAQLRAGRHGFAEHLDATLAWPGDGGTHTDPGPNFPWTKLFARIAEIETPKETATVTITDTDIAAIWTSRKVGRSGYNAEQMLQLIFNNTETIKATVATLDSQEDAIEAGVQFIQSIATQLDQDVVGEGPSDTQVQIAQAVYERLQAQAGGTAVAEGQPAA